MIAEIKDVEIRKASVEDFTIFYPGGAPRTAYAWLALYKGNPACLAGLIIERGGCIAFSEIKPGIHAPKITIWRTARALLDHILALGVPVYAQCALTDKMAQAFVTRLGFSYNRDHSGVGLFKWQ